MAWMTQLREFAKDVQVEATKVSWPTLSELRESTVVVVVMVLLVAVFIGIVDRILTMAIGLLFR